jgi:hypothetical protein
MRNPCIENHRIYYLAHISAIRATMRDRVWRNVCKAAVGNHANGSVRSIIHEPDCQQLQHRLAGLFPGLGSSTEELRNRGIVLRIPRGIGDTEDRHLRVKNESDAAPECDRRVMMSLWGDWQIKGVR